MNENFDFLEIWKNFDANGDVYLNFGNIFAQYRLIFDDFRGNGKKSVFVPTLQVRESILR